MLDGKRVLVVVPARGGSKGIPLKNLAKVCGETLVAHTAKVIKALDFVDHAVVSTDHPDIMREAIACGLKIIARPADLSGDLVSDLRVLEHALGSEDMFEECEFDIIVMLQPTCPMRRVWHVEATVKRLLQGFDSVWTVTRIDRKYHPDKQLRLESGGHMTYYSTMAEYVIARQQLEPTYIRNGAAYAFTRECLLVQQTIMGKKSAAVVIDETLVNIDTPEDLAEAERLMVKQEQFFCSGCGDFHTGPRCYD